jgi:hypothetical protein
LQSALSREVKLTDALRTVVSGRVAHPNRCSASANAMHTARPVARATTFAMTA